MITMLPKFHCEFNPPELKFATGKGRARPLCTGKIATFKRVFREQLDSVTVQEMRRFYRKCRGWMVSLQEDSAGRLDTLAVDPTHTIGQQGDDRAANVIWQSHAAKCRHGR